MTDLVRVWIVPVDVPPATAASCADVLDARERARAAVFVKVSDRRRFVVAHGALRILAGRELGARPAALRWASGQHGKPELVPPWSGLHTSLSHCAGLIAIATATERPVGIDIERLTPGRQLVRLSARFFAPEEASYVAAAASASVRADRFARLWTRKEAIVKAAGGRLWPNLKVTVHDRDIVSSAEPAGTHRLADVPAPAGFRAAVALFGPAPFGVRSSDWPGMPPL